MLNVFFENFDFHDTCYLPFLTPLFSQQATNFYKKSENIPRYSKTLTNSLLISVESQSQITNQQLPRRSQWTTESNSLNRNTQQILPTPIHQKLN